jgi:hypothetical protein
MADVWVFGGWGVQVIIVRSTRAGESVLGADGCGAALRAFSEALNETIRCFEPGQGAQIVTQVDGYASLEKRLGAVGRDVGRQQCISQHQESAIIMISAHAGDSMRYMRYVEHVNSGLPAALARADAVKKSCPLPHGQNCPLPPAARANSHKCGSSASWGPGPAPEPPAPSPPNEVGCYNPKFNATQTGLGMFTKEALEGVEHDLGERRRPPHARRPARPHSRQPASQRALPRPWRPGTTGRRKRVRVRVRVVTLLPVLGWQSTWTWWRCRSRSRCWRSCCARGASCSCR